MKKRKRWFLVAAVVLVAGLSYMTYSLLIHGGADYLSVSQLRSQGEILHDQQVRVGGRVAPGSINWDNKTQVMNFVLTDDRESLTIVYKGIVPDNFKPGMELIVEGKYRSDATLEALSFGSGRSFCDACH